MCDSRTYVDPTHAGPTRISVYRETDGKINEAEIMQKEVKPARNLESSRVELTEQPFN